MSWFWSLQRGSEGVDMRGSWAKGKGEQPVLFFNFSANLKLTQNKVLCLFFLTKGFAGAEAFHGDYFECLKQIKQNCYYSTFLILSSFPFPKQLNTTAF